MHRRSLLKGAGVLALYSSFPVVVSEFLASCNDPGKLKAEFFSPGEFSALEQITDILLPRTSTPGGLDTHTPFFIDKVVNDCIKPQDQQLIRSGLQELHQGEEKRFISFPPEEKRKLISAIDRQAFGNDQGKAWFRMIKKLALIGHFTAREGMTTALNYVKVPDYKACIPYKKGDKALAKTYLMYW